MVVQPGSDCFELADYLGVLRRRWLMIVAFAVAGAAFAGAYYYVAPRVYAATALVQVNALPNNANALGGRTNGPVNMDNEAQVVQSAMVASTVKSKLNSPLTVADLLKEVKVTVPPNTTFLQITCSTGTAGLAASCANVFARAYLDNRRATALGLITSAINELQAQATRLEASVGMLRARVSVHALPAGSAAREVAELQLSAEAARLTTIQSKINSTTPLEATLAAKNSTVGQIVTPALTPSAPASPKKKILLPSGIAAGVVLGLVCAFGVDWMRPRIRSARDIQRRVKLPAVFSLIDAPAAQVFTELAHYVGARMGDGGHVLLATAVTPTGGKGSGATVAANLAAALARKRGDTVLVDAAHDLLHDNVQRVMSELRRDFRYVVIDVPSPDIDAATFRVAEFADAAILSVVRGTTHPAELADCAQRLERAGTAILAAVLLPPGARAPSTTHYDETPPVSTRRTESPGFSGAWRQRNVSETWP